MNITSGIFRGRKLISPNSDKTHPIGSRERLALFNSLGLDTVKNAKVLDVYAGTGALGLEALSRGAAHVTFIEKDYKAATALKSNIKALEVEPLTDIIVKSAEAVDISEEYDIIFADPPYNKPINSEILNKLAKKAKIFVLSHPESYNTSDIDAEKISEKAYANARISIFMQKH